MDELNKRFPDDDACLDYIFKKKYPNLQYKYYRIKTRKAYTNSYGHQISPLSGTIFHRSHIPLKKWFQAIYLFAQSRNGVSGLFLSRHLDITYEGAWRMAHKIRELMKQDELVLKGVVEADETYIGPRYKHRQKKPHTPILGLVQRGGRVNALVGGAETDMILKNISEKVKKGSIIMTDGLKAYTFIPRLGYEHGRVQHGKGEYVNGQKHTNTIENFWGQLKRSLRGTHHFVSAKHLQKYVDEFVFRYNHRDTWDAFQKMLDNI